MAETVTTLNASNPTHANALHVVVAEDDEEMRYLVAQTFRKAGFRVTEIKNGLRLMEYAAVICGSEGYSEHVDLIVSDIRMPGGTGIRFLQGTRDIVNLPPVILITAFGDQRTHELGLELGAVAVIDKPFDLDMLLDRAKAVITSARNRTTEPPPLQGTAP